MLKDFNPVIDLVQCAVRLPSRLADAGWEWVARKLVPQADTTTYNQPDVIA